MIGLGVNIHISARRFERGTGQSSGDGAGIFRCSPFKGVGIEMQQRIGDFAVNPRPAGAMLAVKLDNKSHVGRGAQAFRNRGATAKWPSRASGRIWASSDSVAVNEAIGARIADPVTSA